MSAQVVYAEELKSLATGSISGSYAAVGSSFSEACRIVTIINATDGDMIFSLDGSTDHLFLPARTPQLFDWNANRDRLSNFWVMAPGTQIYVKQSTAPSSGSVYVECLYGG